jgi:hypothetical protein
MYLTKEKKQEIFKKHGKSENDSGSPEGQVALFTARINHLTEVKSPLLVLSVSDTERTHQLKRASQQLKA